MNVDAQLEMELKKHLKESDFMLLVKCCMPLAEERKELLDMIQQGKFEDTSRMIVFLVKYRRKYHDKNN